MRVQWSGRAISDLVRLHEFLASKDPQAADRTLDALSDAAGRLIEYPRIGEKLVKYQPREVRRILIEQYEIRYEVKLDRLEILRIWHTREHR